MSERVHELTDSKLALLRSIQRIYTVWKDGNVSDYEYTVRHKEYSTLLTWVEDELRTLKEREAA